MISTILDTLPQRAQKQFAKSIIGSLNSSIIGNIRGHIRVDALEQVGQSDEVPNIDMFNEAMAAIDEARSRDEAFENTGMVSTMSYIEIAQRQNVIREFLVDFLQQNKSSAYDIPLSIADTLEFQVNNAPSVNEEKLKQLAEAMNLDYEQLKHVQIEAFRREKESLMKVTGQVLTIVSTLDDGFHKTEDGVEYSFTGTVDEAFDSLPEHVRFKLVASAIKALNKADDDALMQLLRFNKMEGATDSTLIKASRDECTKWLVAFQEKHREALDAYLERNGSLPEIVLPPKLNASAISASLH